MRRLIRWLVSTTKGRVVVAALVVAAIPLLWLAWWLGSPLFLDKTVIEEFPARFGRLGPREHDADAR